MFAYSLAWVNLNNKTILQTKFEFFLFLVFMSLIQTSGIAIYAVYFEPKCVRNLWWRLLQNCFWGKLFKSLFNKVRGLLLAYTDTNTSSCTEWGLTMWVFKYFIGMLNECPPSPAQRYPPYYRRPPGVMRHVHSQQRRPVYVCSPRIRELKFFILYTQFTVASARKQTKILRGERGIARSEQW